MRETWKSSFQDWYRHWRRRRRYYGDDEPSYSIELGPTPKDPKRVDSGISFGTSSHLNGSHATPKLYSQPRDPDSIHLIIDLGDETCTKSLDYGTFSRWSAIEGLIVDMEKDGIFCEELWDISESMRVCKGDWDARARPGWDIHVLCQQAPAMPNTLRVDEDTDSDSEDPDIERYQWIDDVLDHYQEEWCLPRWRDKVEPEGPMSKSIRDPSWTMLALGCTSVAFFMVAVVIYIS